MNFFQDGFAHEWAFKGGGGGGGGPSTTTVASTPPPPTTQSVEIQQAQRDARRQAAKKKGLSSTILAGETGGYQPGQTLGGGPGMAAPWMAGQDKKTLLGGG